MPKITATPTAEPNIVDKVTAYLNKYMVFPEPEQAEACALWALHTWTFSESFPETPYTTPYLYVNSLEARSGKTLLIDLLEPIVLNPERTIDMSSSVMFRLIEHVHPTLFIDEVDTVWDGAKQADLARVINGGYKRGGYVWRNAPGKDGPEPTKFGTFSPKLLAGIDNDMMPETVRSRCLEIQLRRVGTLDDEGQLVAPDGTVRETYYQFLAGPEAEELTAQIEAFVAQWKVEWKRYMPKPIKGISPRSWEIAFPLIQLAAYIGIEDRAREVLAKMFTPKAPKDNAEQAALRTIHTYFQESGAEKVHTETLCNLLGEGWNGKLFSNRIGKLLDGAPTTLGVGNVQRKGYYKHQFTSAFTRHLGE